MLPEFYQRYVDRFDGQTVAAGMAVAGNQAVDFYKGIPSELYNYRYADGKWTIKEVLAHIIDGERIFAYRALRFARNDQTELPGFDENQYATEMNIEERSFPALIEEFMNVRSTSVDLWTGFSDEMLNRKGVASGVEFSVEDIGKILVGHEKHHRNVVVERYLNQR